MFSSRRFAPLFAAGMILAAGPSLSAVPQNEVEANAAAECNQAMDEFARVMSMRQQMQDLVKDHTNEDRWGDAMYLSTVIEPSRQLAEQRMRNKCSGMQTLIGALSAPRKG